MVAAVAALSDETLVVADPIGVRRAIGCTFRFVDGVWTLLVVGYTIPIAEIETMIHFQVGGALRLLTRLAHGWRGEALRPF